MNTTPVRTHNDTVTDSDLTPTQLAIWLGTCYGTIDGSHHRLWAIDQMQRALMNCPAYKLVRKFFDDGVLVDEDVYYGFTGTSYEYEAYCDEFIKDYYEDAGWEEYHDSREEALKEELWGVAP